MFDAELAKLFLSVDLELRIFVGKDGKLFLKLEKALYGCIHTSHLWQENLTETLIRMRILYLLL